MSKYPKTFLTKYIFYFPKKILLACIRLYQLTLSRDHGWLKYRYPCGYCRFQPTCSEYAHEAITRYGVVRGGIKSIRRILSCHPWHEGGWDPV